ncbi:hypothetical protein ACJD0Z_02025 [Flavobacteriaceae bacterium M23B6Z8]
MKTIFLILTLTLLTSQELLAQTEFELEPSQSMLMTGKGPGQDATINPYDGQDCLAIVQNMGARSFSVRIQEKGKLINEISVLKGETKKIKLLAGYELYLDPNPEGKTKASVSYEKIGDK